MTEAEALKEFEEWYNEEFPWRKGYGSWEAKTAWLAAWRLYGKD